MDSERTGVASVQGGGAGGGGATGGGVECASRGQDEDRTDRPRIFRPILSADMERVCKAAAGMAGVSVPRYLNTIVIELVRADARARAIQLADAVVL